MDGTTAKPISFTLNGETVEALPGETICPTFRTQSVGRLTPPPQPRLVPRTLAAVAAGAAA